MPPEEYELKKVDSETKLSNTGGTNTSELNRFFDNDSIKANQETIENVLNKEENKSLKQGFEEFLIKEKNVIKKNAIKLKLSKATDEITIKSIIAEVMEGGYKIGDKKNKGEYVGNGEKIGDEKIKENQNGNLEDNLQQKEEKKVQAEEDIKQKEEDIKQKEEDIKQKEEDIKQKEEDIKQKEEDIKQKEEDIKQKEEDIKQKKEKAEKKEFENEMLKAIEYRQKLKETHKDLETKTGPGTDLYENTKNQLERKGILKKLKDDKHDETFVNNYILVQATLQEVKDNTSEYSQDEISTFDKIVKNLNNSCNIPDTNLDSFSKENIGDTRKDLFDEDIGNESLRETKKSNLESRKYPEGLFDIKDDEMISKYGKFLEGDLKVFWLQFQTNPDIRNKINNIQNNPNPTDEDKQFLDNYNQMHSAIESIKEDSDTKTKELMEELCIVSQIKGMYMCMGEGENFNLNKAKEIETEKINDETFLTLKGHIDGIDFAIRQNTSKEAPLQTSTKLVKEGDSKDTNKKENFTIGGEDKFVYSNFILPTQDEIFDTITKTIQSDSSLENSNNQEEYLEKLQTNIMGKMEEKYKKTEDAHHYMKEQVKGEKIIDKTISFVENIKGSELDSTVTNSNEQLYNFLNLMDFNIRYSDGAEKDKLYKIIDKINSMSELAMKNSNDGELENHNDKFGQYLTGNTLLKTRNILRGNIAEGESSQYSFDLFKKYKKEGDSRNIGDAYIINFDQMLIDFSQVETQKKDDKDIAELDKIFDTPGAEYPENLTLDMA